LGEFLILGAKSLGIIPAFALDSISSRISSFIWDKNWNLSKAFLSSQTLGKISYPFLNPNHLAICIKVSACFVFLRKKVEVKPSKVNPRDKVFPPTTMNAGAWLGICFDVG